MKTIKSATMCVHGYDELETGKVCEVCEAEKRAVEDERRWAEVEIQRKAQQERLDGMYNVWRDKIVAAVKAAGKYARREDNKLMVMGVDMTYRVSFEEIFEKTYSRFRSNATGKYAIVVEYSGSRNRFKPRQKDGSYNFDKIAERLIEIANSVIAKAKLDGQRLSNESVAKQFVTDNRVRQYGSFNVRPSQDKKEPLFVEFKLGRSMTVAEAKLLHDSLVQLGLVVREPVKEETNVVAFDSKK